MINPNVFDSSYEKKIKNEGFDLEAVYRWRRYISPFYYKLITLLTKNAAKHFGYIIS